jgi:endothelin-converting enzyme/putative endopeptidase
MRKFLLMFVIASLPVNVVVAQGSTKTGPATQPQSSEVQQVPSFEASAMDKTADPCADFYQFSCGGWLKSNPIPPDQASWGRFNELAERNRTELRGILENAAKATNRDANEQKICDY